MNDTIEVNQAFQERLWEAARLGDTATIRMLAMSDQVDVNAKNEDGFDAFNIATQAGKAEAATTILAAREVQYMRELGMIDDQGKEVKGGEGKKTA